MKRRLPVLGVAIAAVAASAGVALAASSPAVVTGTHSKLKQTSVVLNATVNPNGSATVYFFQLGLAVPGYGLASHPRSAGSGTTTVSVKTTSGGLIPGTVYHYRIIAYNKFGATIGADRTFKTKGFAPPAAATGPPTQVGRSFVTLTGVVNPNGTTTSYYFQYGTSTSYGSQTFAGTLAGHAAAVVSVPVTGLASGTIFHYRLVATHSGFPPQADSDVMFMTLPAHPPTPRLRARTTPHRVRHRPFVFTTAGTVAGPSWIPAQFACSGEVKIRLIRGRRTVALTVAAVQPNCSFVAQTSLARKPGHGPRHRHVSLRVLIRFAGNGYLARARLRQGPVVVG
ncbi:MAG: hypothetical protein M3018_08340 [Actinomycetota bacterium]|nr:hypothetical protein [Actinomycetota bacterium]